MGFRDRYRQKNGYRDVLKVGLPLVVSLGSITLMQFTDRLFLSHYSLDAIAAVVPAGILSFLVTALFFGVAQYTSVFVAQYMGAGRPERVGAAMWQGIWFSLVSAVVLAALSFLSGPLFDVAGHPPAVAALEKTYFRILTFASGLAVLEQSLCCFYSGQGLTRTVMIVNLAGAALNIPLDYCLINGLFFFPEMGIAGAALATAASWGFMAVVYLALIFTKANEARFRIRSARAFEAKLFTRLMRFGLPSGVQVFLDLFAFTFFVFMVGRYGAVEMAATNMVLAIDTLAYLPLIGLSVAVSILVGQAMGAGKTKEAETVVKSSLHISLAAMAVAVVCFLFLPETLLNLFRSDAEPEALFGSIRSLGVVLLRFVAVYTLLDAVAMVYFGALKGAGDVRYTMWAMGGLSLVLVIVPVFLAVAVLDLGIYILWLFLTIYVLSLATAFYRRYKRGPWRNIRLTD